MKTQFVLIAGAAVIGLAYGNRADAQVMQSTSRVGYWSNLSGTDGSAIPQEGLGTRDPSTGEVTAGTPDSYGSFALDPNALAVTAYYVGGYISQAYASIQNPSTTNIYSGDPTLNLFSFGEIAQIQGISSATTVMDNVDCLGYAEWHTGDPSAGYSYTNSSFFDSAQSNQANDSQKALDVISIPAGAMWCFSGSIAAHDDGPQQSGGGGGGDS